MQWTTRIPDRGPARLTISKGRIEAVEPVEDAPEETFASGGWIDLQINGYGGINFSDPELDPATLAGILPGIWSSGVTQFLPTLITNTPEALLRGFERLESAREADSRFAASVPGYHLEGPYLSAGPSQGAHRPEYMKDPDWAEFQRFQEAAGGRIRILTLAPEREGAPEFIRRAVDSGVRIALSHTDAEPAVIHRAVEAGATLNTHLGNGCPQTIDRHRAPLWAQLSNPLLISGLICDGFHLIPDFVRIVRRLKGPGGCFLVTDAVHVAGLPPGDYDLAGKPIQLLSSGKVITGNQGSLAGATVPLHRCLANFLNQTGCSLNEGLALVCENPAHILDLPEITTALQPGQPANLVRFTWKDGAIAVQETLLNGETVFHAS